MRRMLARYHAWLLLSLIGLVSIAGAWAISLAIPLPGGNDFNIVDWELRHATGKWRYLAGRLLRGDLSSEEEERRLERFLLLSAQISQLERSLAAEQTEPLGRLRGERDGLENDVEAIIEGRVTAVLEEAGLASSIPFFPDGRWVFPPVDVEFDQPPRVLSVSPRDRIELLERRPLRPGLSLEEAIAEETALEAGGDRSALVQTVSGVATYPSAVPPRGDYRRLVETVAHEWVHHYLFFKPLGRRYFSNVELKTLNETAANLAGRDIAALVVQRYPLRAEVREQIAALSPAPASVDVGALLRQLRLDVDALLADDRVADAEALMEERRQGLAEQGVVFRRINQAFFATRNIYADTPGSIDPLGAKLALLRERAGSVGEFLRAAAQLKSGADLDRLLGDGARSTGPGAGASWSGRAGVR